MSNIFPKWTNRLPLILTVGVLVACCVVAELPIILLQNTHGWVSAYSTGFIFHEIHSGQMGIDCRYCHNDVDAWYSNIPSAETCMKCHSMVLAEDPRLEPIGKV